MQGHHSTGCSVFPVVVGRLGRQWAPSASLQHHLQPKEHQRIPLASSSPASQTQELHAKAVLLGAHAGLLQDTVLGWGHPGYPEVSQMCCPTCIQLSPRAVPAGSGLTHLLGITVLLLMVMLCCQLGASRNYSSQPGAGVLLHPAARSCMECSSPPATVGQGALTSCLLSCAAHTIWRQPVPGWEPCKRQVLCEGLAEPSWGCCSVPLRQPSSALQLLWPRPQHLPR